MEAYLYESLPEQRVRCHLCHHRCVISEGKRGICAVRENRGGTLETLVFGKVIARNVDPIEKKPLFHFLPGSLSYSIATVGCNLKCRFCQNADIAQLPSDRNGMIVGDSCSPGEIVADAQEKQCASIAYTYTEPTVFFEFAYETSQLANRRGIRNVFVTNGYMTPEAIGMISPFLDAVNVDLKTFSESTYRKYCGAKLEPVTETLMEMKSRGILVEVTTLIIPGMNDQDVELKQLASFLTNDLGPETPWHISRFHPTYRLTDRPPTPLETLVRARRIGLDAGLRYVYTGNVPGEKSENTYCYRCGELLIDRMGFSIRRNTIEKGCCPSCGTRIDGVEM